MLPRPLLLSALSALLLPGPWALATEWPAAVVNPKPLPGDVLVAMPCDGAMVFRPILIPRPGDAPAGFTDLAGPFGDQGGRRWYLLGKYEVNRRQYAAVRAWGQAGACPAPAADTDALAQDGLSWHAAMVFAATWQAWLKARQDRLPDCDHRPIAPCVPRLAGQAAHLRLPTEAEWEFAVRGANAVGPAAFQASRYPDAGSIAAHAWHDANAGGAAQPIGRLRPNPLGLHDLYGNVAELTQAVIADDPDGPAVILRGGSHRHSDSDLHSATRHREGLYDARGPRQPADGGLRMLIGAPVPAAPVPTELAWCLGATGRGAGGGPGLTTAPACPPPAEPPGPPSRLPPSQPPPARPSPAALALAEQQRQALIAERDEARAQVTGLRATLAALNAQLAAAPAAAATPPPGWALTASLGLNLLLALLAAALGWWGLVGRQRSVSFVEVLGAWGQDLLDRLGGNLRPVGPPRRAGPAGAPDLTGLPAAEVQALQRAAAEALGLPVVVPQPALTLVAPATGERVPVTLPELVVIPGGRFWMGSPDDEPGRWGDEGPRHQVRIRPFAIGRTAVTFAQYDAFCAATGRRRRHDAGWGREQRPVINVNWEDAQAYLAWLRTQTGQRWRLPSEAEWEYAARAGTDTPFWTGRCIHTDQANFDGTRDDQGCGAGSGAGSATGSGTGAATGAATGGGVWRGQTLPVASLPANPFGLYEVLGNVWEWVEDCYHEGYGGAPTNGSAWQHGDCRWRVIRGGAWSPGPARLRSANRGRYPPADRSDALGFRVAMDLPLHPGRPRAAALSGSGLHSGPDPAPGSGPGAGPGAGPASAPESGPGAGPASGPA